MDTKADKEPKESNEAQKEGEEVEGKSGDDMIGYHQTT